MSTNDPASIPETLPPLPRPHPATYPVGVALLALHAAQALWPETVLVALPMAATFVSVAVLFLLNRPLFEAVRKQPFAAGLARLRQGHPARHAVFYGVFAVVVAQMAGVVHLQAKTLTLLVLGAAAVNVGIHVLWERR